MDFGEKNETRLAPGAGLYERRRCATGVCLFPNATGTHTRARSYSSLVIFGFGI